MRTLKVSDIYEYPGLRHCTISDDSGEQFYHEFLNYAFYRAISNKEELYVDLDDTSGYAPSFLDEAFGNLIYDFSLEVVNKWLLIKSDQEPEWKDMLMKETFLQWEERRLNKNKPKITGGHKPWYRFNGVELVLFNND